MEAARLYAQSPNSSILYAMGITQHVTGTNNVLALANLAMVAGQIGKPFFGGEPPAGTEQCPGGLRHGRAAQCLHRDTSGWMMRPCGRNLKRPGAFPSHPIRV